MGPRPFERGNVLSELHYTGEVRLQWGRALSSAEIGSIRFDRGGRAPASMGPRPFERGNRRARRCGRFDFTASMGPRPFERGNRVVGDLARELAEQLQWGRALSSAEISGGCGSFSVCIELQWGRALSSAEIP